MQVLLVCLRAAIALVLAILLPATEARAEGSVAVPVYRLYNVVSSEHLYTTSRAERDALSGADWAYEGVGWWAPAGEGDPVYRLYNPGLGDHHYTMSAGERDALVASHGWRYEGVAFLSDKSQGLPLHRLYNGRLRAGQHHYTASAGERDALSSQHGWKREGVGWWGLVILPRFR